MNKKILFSILIGVVLVGCGFAYWKGTAEKATYMTVEKQTVEKTTQLNAVVDASNKRHPVTMEDAMVLSLYHKKGDAVKKDDPIMEIEISKRDLMNQAVQSQIELLNALTSQVGNEKILEAAKPYLEIYNKAFIQYNEAKAQYDNVVGLMSAGAVNAADIKESALTLTEKTDRLYTAEDKLWSYVSQLDPNLYKGQEKTYKAVSDLYQQAKGEQKRQVIKAAIDGVVTDVYVEEGLMIKKNGLLFELADPSKLLVQTEIEESDSSSLKLGMAGDLSIKNKGDVQQVVIQSIAKSATEKVNGAGVVKKVVPVVFKFSSDQYAAALSDQGTVKLVLGSIENAVAIPKALVKDNQGHYSVFVNVKGRVAEKPITVALVGDKFLAISKGLKVGDQIIKPSKELKVGDRLQ